jgi:hypothetical protein
MGSNPVFSIRSNAADTEILCDFHNFLEKQSLDKIEVSTLVEEFRSFVLPQVRRIIALTNTRSNVDFSRSFYTTKGSISVELSTDPRNMFQRIYAFLRR